MRQKGREKANSQADEEEKREIWEAAQDVASLLGPPHPLFHTAVRSLMALSHTNVDRFSLHETYPLNTLTKSKTFQSVLYHAGLTMHEMEVAMIEKLSLKNLIAVFPPDELACIIATLYVYRNCRKVVDLPVWSDVSKEIQLQMEAGYLIGTAIPAIGTPRGLLVGSIRYVALSLFSIESGRTFKLFKRRLEEDELLYDLEREQELWGCNHLQVAAVILQKTGFGLPAAKGLCPELNSDEENAAGGGAETQVWSATKRWIEAVLQEETPPKEYSAGPYALPKEKFDELEKKIEAIFENGSTFDWIDKSSADLPEDILSQLAPVASSKKPATASAAIDTTAPEAETVDPEEVLKDL